MTQTFYWPTHNVAGPVMCSCSWAAATCALIPEVNLTDTILITLCSKKWVSCVIVQIYYVCVDILTPLTCPPELFTKKKKLLFAILVVRAVFCGSHKPNPKPNSCLFTSFPSTLVNLIPPPCNSPPHCTGWARVRPWSMLYYLYLNLNSVAPHQHTNSLYNYCGKLLYFVPF